MPSASSDNGPHSAEMSLITQQMQRYDGRDEARFLQQQADDARLAIKQTLARMRKTSQDAADVRWWTQRYPWYAVGGAGLLGFVAATYLSAAAHGPEQSSRQTVAEAWSQSSVFEGIFSSLVPLVRSVLMSAIVGALQTCDEEPATRQPSAASASYSEQ